MAEFVGIVERLREALKNGEIIEIIYNAGSQPGSRREIMPLKVNDEEVRAKCFQSNSVKTFKVRNIDLCVGVGDKNIPIYDSSIERVQYGQNFKIQHSNATTKKQKRVTLKGGHEGSLSGKVFLFTGSLSSFTRDEAKDLVESLGGSCASSVGKKVDFVVAGEEAGSKYAKAKELGLSIISEDEFKSMVGR